MDSEVKTPAATVSSIEGCRMVGDDHRGEARRGMRYISVVIPVYQAEDILPLLCERLEKVLSAISESFEMVLVDDRSRDKSWEVLRQLAEKYPQLMVVRLSRNFGQPFATTAGLDVSNGQWTVVMDCDLQDRPEEIPRLLDKALEGYDVVIARRAVRQDTFRKRMSSYLFWKVFSIMSGYQVDNTVASFRIMRRTVVEAYCRIPERARIFGGLVDWLGFATAYVDVQHMPRHSGRSSYNLIRLLRLAADGIISFSNRPLYASIVVGAVISALAACYGTYQLARYFLFSESSLPGWLSTVTLLSFLGGLVLLNQGIMGLYIARIYNQSKGRPLYVIDRIVMGSNMGTAATVDAHCLSPRLEEPEVGHD